ncbi:response regulator transcription factor [Eggerthella timonensis]|uniref:response regulator transcription factor n=1 Tax=Eggerthella timonensis TaxID=1871008 RepID=UPI000C757465|nr:response regulator transcription factor [Eggerthella timonensis]
MNILVIEDDRNLSSSVKRCLEPAYRVDCAYDGAEGLFLAERGTYDLVVLDLMLPQLDGFAVLERLRKKGVSTPVLILTAKGALADKAKGFRAGADDYLVKPFYRDELALRIEAILRRALGARDDGRLAFKDLVLAPSDRTASVAGAPLDLKGKQFDALEYLVSRKGRILTKSQIFDKVWGYTSDTSSNVVAVCMNAIRNELRPHGYDRYLRTVRGCGYLLAEDEPHA